MKSEEERLLIARGESLDARAKKGEIAATAFLTPAELKKLKTAFSHLGKGLFQWGGYREAERCRLFFLPDYIADAEGEWREDLLKETLDASVTALSVKGSGYAELSHRDYLGAVLNLGIERDALGDIAVLGPHEAVLFTDALMATFLRENLERVARDKVTVFPAVLPPDFSGGRTFEEVTDTVASSRADAVVAALVRLSREKAAALFREERVEVDYETEEKTDRLISEGAVISVRGFGKFIVRSLSDKTKKGRYRLRADRYV